MKYLIQTVETYRADTEPEAESLIEEAKVAKQYVLAKYSIEKKEVKAQGEIFDEYYKLTLTKSFTSIKEPDSVVSVSYEVE